MKINIFNIVLYLKGFNIRYAQAELRKIQMLDIISFKEDMERKKWEQFKFHLENNKFYNNFINNRIVIEWSDIPLLSKKEIQKPLRYILTDGYEKKSLFKNSTSGSTGKPFYFAKDKLAHSMTWALIIHRYKVHGIEYGKSLQARFYGIPLSGYKYYVEKVKDFISSRVRFPVFDLSEKVLDKYIKLFSSRPFEYINGYTASLVFFANHCIKRSVVLKEICPTLKICIPTSEICTLEDREILQKGFGVKIVNEYGCAEMDILAIEDADGDWITSNENVFIEIVDENNNPLPNGQTGKILLTSLYNKAIPLIRYEVGDLGALSMNSKGKYNVLQNLSGRINDFAIMPNGRKVPALTFYYVTKTLIKEYLKVNEFVIKQIKLNEFIVEYSSEKEFDDKIKKIVKIAFDNYLEPGLHVRFSKVENIERGKSGKFKQFISLIH